MEEIGAMRIRTPKKRLGALKRLIERGFPFERTLKALKGCESRRLLLLGTPLHLNLGDHLLAESEKRFLRQIAKDSTLFEIPTDLYLAFKERVLGELQPGDTVLVTGGGWMGDLWPRDELILEDMVKSATQVCKTIVLPQTVFYSNGSSDAAKRAGEFWRSCSNYLLCVREQASYDICMHTLGIERSKIALLPDMGLIYSNDADVKNAERKRGRIGFCIRDDIESSVSRSSIARINHSFISMNYSCVSLTTMAEKLFPYFEREEIIRNRISEFADVDLVVTDRLHGMIFAYLSGTPCIALDNATGKVRGVHDKWLRDCPSIVMPGNDYDAFVADLDMNKLTANYDADVLFRRHYNLISTTLGEAIYGRNDKTIDTRPTANPSLQS